MKLSLTLALVLTTLLSTYSAAVAETPKKTEEMTIVEVAAGNKDFSTLVAAVKAAGLVETLSGKGPFTVLAPTNAAFDALPKGTVETLLKPENKAKLVGILTYHVVGSKAMAADVVKLSEAKTVQGQSVKIQAGTDGVKINNAKVIKTDIVCKNGVIHVIDAVLLPSDK
jgi:uncharacterized surface protein with fasciclin (FAS1) repeats